MVGLQTSEFVQSTEQIEESAMSGNLETVRLIKSLSNKEKNEIKKKRFYYFLSARRVTSSPSHPSY